ncbi:hypothetical protein PR048_030406 [Dryococelus australis]|uniref:Uncharacterized protein n=1 Tax=Dryococelus australis TaxID=614101 RepID=A0ABQ9G8W5_9NEOP|nr:hypothetical protein PR048_030406 [Dryococelus australis]
MLILTNHSDQCTHAHNQADFPLSAFTPRHYHSVESGHVKVATWLKEFCMRGLFIKRGSARGDRDIRIDSLIASTIQPILRPKFSLLVQSHSAHSTLRHTAVSDAVRWVVSCSPVCGATSGVLARGRYSTDMDCLLWPGGERLGSWAWTNLSKLSLLSPRASWLMSERTFVNATDKRCVDMFARRLPLLCRLVLGWRQAWQTVCPSRREHDARAALYVRVVLETRYPDTTTSEAAVAERLARSLPTKANRVQAPAGVTGFSQVGIVPDDMPFVGGFSQGYPVSPSPRRTIFASLTLIGSQTSLLRAAQISPLSRLSCMRHISAVLDGLQSWHRTWARLRLPQRPVVGGRQTRPKPQQVCWPSSHRRLVVIASRSDCAASCSRTDVAHYNGPTPAFAWGVISENHGKQKLGWPDRESNPVPPECESSESYLRATLLGAVVNINRHWALAPVVSIAFWLQHDHQDKVLLLTSLLELRQKSSTVVDMAVNWFDGSVFTLYRERPITASHLHGDMYVSVQRNLGSVVRNSLTHTHRNLFFQSPALNERAQTLQMSSRVGALCKEGRGARRGGGEGNANWLGEHGQTWITLVAPSVLPLRDANRGDPKPIAVAQIPIIVQTYAWLPRCTTPANMPVDQTIPQIGAGARANRVRFLAGSLPVLRMWESCETMPLIGGFSRGSPVTLAPFIPALLHTNLGSPSSALKTSTSRAAQITQLMDTGSITSSELQLKSDRVNVTSLDAEFRTRPRPQERPNVDTALRGPAWAVARSLCFARPGREFWKHLSPSVGR